MKYIGINRDKLPQDTPEGFGVDARNGINFKYLGASVNEGGFKVYQKSNIDNNKKYGLPVTISGTSYTRKPIGEIYIDNNSFVIFSVGYLTNTINNTINSVFSEIGYLTNEGEYITLINDLVSDAKNKLNFNSTYPFTGESTRNYLNEIIIAATDNNTKPLYFNVTKLLTTLPNTNISLNEILMFPDINMLNTDITISDTGGNLENGAYYLGYVFENKDLSVSSNTLYSNPIFIFNEPVGTTTTSFNNVAGDLTDLITSKLINVTLNNVNTNYTGVKVLALIKRQGITTAKYIKRISINSSTVSFTLDSSEALETISLQEALIPKLKFTKVYKFSQVYNRLYATRTTTNSFRDFQKYANLVKVGFKSKLISLETDRAIKKDFNYDKKTFIHKEVYALYIHLVLNDGTVTEGFHIPYNRLNDSQITSAGYRDSYSSHGIRPQPTNAHNQSLGDSVKRFQIEDTCEYTISEPDSVIKGKLGFWENEDERYPAIGEKGSENFESVEISPGVFSEDLRGKRVRHHRMPSMNWFLENNYWTNGAGYGKTHLDILGLDISNVVIPDDIKPFVKSWFISFAQRDYNNATVLGQSISLMQSTTDWNWGGQTSIQYPKTWFSGFNGISYFNKYAFGFYVKPVTPYTIPSLTKSMIRFYDFGLNKNTPDINPVYIHNEFYLKTSVNFRVTANCNSNNTDGNNAASWSTEYNKSTASVEKTSEVNVNGDVTDYDVRFRRITNYKYLAANTIDGDNYNNTLENCLLLEIDSDTVDKTIPIENYNIGWLQGLSFSFNNGSFLSTLMANPLNIYNSYQNQKLVHTGIYVDVDTTTAILYKGDGFTNTYSFHTGGWGAAPLDKLYVNGDAHKGVRNLYVHLCESTSNLALRSSDDSSPNTQFYPKDDFGYYVGMSREPIKLNTLYNNDYSSLNNIVELVPYDYNKIYVDEDFYKINRTIAQQLESSDTGWKTWLANDYHIIKRNKGKIINIEGWDRDLIINTENTMLFTVGNEQLNIDSTNAFVGAGNIFERPAMELNPSKEGNFGTRHRFSCLLTSFGYVSIDAEKGTINLFDKSKTYSISNAGLIRWFYDNLKYSNKLYYGTDENDYIEVLDDNPYVGFGFTVAFDYEYERLLISKKHYTFTELAKNKIINGTLVFVNNKFIADNSIDVPFENSTYFINNCFTVSYDVNNKAFTYFHDYHPNKLFNARNKIFCFKEKQSNSRVSANRLFIMNQDNKGIYDNTSIIDIDQVNQNEASTPYPFFVTLNVNKGDIAKEFKNISWLTSVVNKNGGNYPQETFDKIACFTSYQTTGLTTLVPFSFDTYFESNIRNIKNKWFFNRLRDYLNKNNYNSGEPFLLDYSTIDTSKLDLTKPIEELAHLIDYWMIVKLQYDNTISLNNQKEIRILQIDSDFLPVPR